MINDEVYADLIHSYHHRWKYLKEKPPLDAPIEGLEFIQQTNYFKSFSITEQMALYNRLEIKTLSSGEQFRFHSSEKTPIVFVFISTGATLITTHENHHKHLVKMGTGEHILILKENQLHLNLYDQPHWHECQITALSYTKLYILKESDYTLLDR